METNNYKQEILSKLANNEDLTEEEIEWMFEEFEQVNREIIETDKYHNLIFSVFKVDENLYYGLRWLSTITDYANNEYDMQPFRVKKTTKTVEVFEPYED